MHTHTIRALALLFAAGALTADAQGAHDGSAPQLRVIQMTGEISVTNAENAAESSGETKLPYVMPGSEVRVLTGTALFQTDSRATLKATQGDAFRFTASEQDGEKAPAMRITAVGKDTSLHLDLGSKRFLLRDSGSVDIGYASDGVTPVTVLGGHVALLDGSYLDAGEQIVVSTTRARGGSLAAQDRVVTQMPAERGFEMLPVNLSALVITRVDEATFLARTSRTPAAGGDTARLNSAERAVESWPVISRLTAGFIIEKYGAPTKSTPAELTWEDNGPWTKTVVHRVGMGRSAPRRILHQTVAYDVPRAKVADLERMDMGLKADRARKELSAVGESEEANFLALNLANDVIVGRLSVADAKAAYDKTFALDAAGKSSPYTEGLSFERRGIDME